MIWTGRRNICLTDLNNVRFLICQKYVSFWNLRLAEAPLPPEAPSFAVERDYQYLHMEHHS